jgi:hypothetical protein
MHTHMHKHMHTHTRTYTHTLSLSSTQRDSSRINPELHDKVEALLEKDSANLVLDHTHVEVLHPNVCKGVGLEVRTRAPPFLRFCILLVKGLF